MKTYQNIAWHKQRLRKPHHRYRQILRTFLEALPWPENTTLEPWAQDVPPIICFQKQVPHCDEVILRDRDVVQLDAVPYQKDGWLISIAYSLQQMILGFLCWNDAPQKWPGMQKERIVFQPPFFRGELLNFRDIAHLASWNEQVII